MPLRLRVCGRRAGAVEIGGASGEEIGDATGEDPAGEGLGDDGDDGPVSGLGEALLDDAQGVEEDVAGAGLLGEGDSPGVAGDEGDDGVTGREPGVGASARGEIGRAHV